MEELRIEASTGNLSRVLKFLDQILEKSDCPMKEQMQIDLAAEEVFVNIASYAYQGNRGDAVVTAEILESPRRIRVSFQDEGVSFDPLSQKEPDVSLPLEDRGIGGLGIFLVRKTMNEVKYERREGKNILTFIKVF